MFINGKCNPPLKIFCTLELLTVWDNSKVVPDWLFTVLVSFVFWSVEISPSWPATVFRHRELYWPGLENVTFWARWGMVQNNSIVCRKIWTAWMMRSAIVTSRMYGKKSNPINIPLYAEDNLLACALTSFMDCSRDDFEYFFHKSLNGSISKPVCVWV